MISQKEFYNARPKLRISCSNTAYYVKSLLFAFFGLFSSKMKKIWYHHDGRIEIINKQAVVDKDSIIKTPASGIIFNKLNNF